MPMSGMWSEKNIFVAPNQDQLGIKLFLTIFFKWLDKIKSDLVGEYD